MKNLLSSSYTGRAPRTLEAAFGPYQRQSHVAPPDLPMDWQEKVILAACIVAAIALIVLLMMGWVK